MARPRLGESESKRLQMVITEDELAAIDEWRFANRVGSRSEAVRRLCQIGLQADADVSGILDVAVSRSDRQAALMSNIFKQQPAADSPEAVASFQFDLMNAFVDAVEDLSDLTGAVSEIAEKSNAFRGQGDIATLVQKAGEISEQFARTRSVIAKGRPPRLDAGK